MQKTKIAMLSVLTALTIVPMLAFAETDETEDLARTAGEVITEVVTITAAGASAGALLSIIRVIGKKISDAKESFIMSKFVLTVLVGAGVGAVFGFIGIDPAAATGIDFIVVYFVSQVLYPIFANRQWTSGK